MLHLKIVPLEECFSLIISIMKRIRILLSVFILTLCLNPNDLRSENPIHSNFKQELFEIQGIYHANSDKKKIEVKNKKFKVKIKSNNDMGNATLVLMLNGKIVKHQIKEVGTESMGSKVKVITAVIYEITIETDGLLKLNENELIIKGYGTAQTKNFIVKS
jgi:hypothetical protein